MKKIEVNVDNHDGIDKSFMVTVGDRLAFNVEYDDVYHPEVDAMTRALKDVVEKHWDESLFKKYFKEELKKDWDENKKYYADEYKTFEEFIKDKI